jgi:hypothetical protein
MDMGNVSLIVMEQGGAWPRRVAESEDVVVVHDDSKVLLQRTLQKVESLRRRGQHLRIAVLACNAATDRMSVARRAEVANELLRAVAAVGFGRLLLSTAHDASARLRRELRALANALSRTFAGTAAAVTVRFGDLDSAHGAASPSSERTRAVGGVRAKSPGRDRMRGLGSRVAQAPARDARTEP